ncbi:type VI secretion system baseplate subunit TssG [Escherichia coli]|nr:type VI secretion system baseplate subunit TssG [Escherichia coli]
MTTTFMGLQGSQSPLPGYYLDHLAWKAVHEQSPVGDFLDMFSHRLTQFVWHIWRKYRYHISFRNGGVDAFSQRMYSLVGLGHRQLRDKLAINHSKMLAYSGILANPGRSPEIICGLVSHCFDLSEVTLQNWQRRKVDIEPDQQNSLGSYSLKNGEKLAGRSVLGNFVLGTRVPDLSGKFQLSITSLTRKQFLSFLPSGENFLPLTMFVSFILRDQLAWDLHLGLTEQYISDYTATWRAGMDNLNIRNFESIGQLTGALEQVISGDQPLQRALTVLRDNTQPGVFSEKLSAKEREEALAEPDYQLLTRLGHEFAPENSTLAVQKDKESTMQAVYQQLTELHRYLLAIQNAPVPGKSALKAVQLRLDQNSSDPIFATRQMAKTLPAPLNRWVGRLTDQAWHVVMVEAVHYMEVDWRDSVVKPFNEQLANNYPFNPRSAQDASLDAFERFFKPDGILDTFYQQNLKLFIDNDLSLEDGDNNVIIREDIIAQLETAQKIRDIFFSKQNGLGTSFAVETVSLSGNKRRSVLNLDGQLVDYSQGRNYTAHLVWPNNMREGNESKLTLIGTSGNAPRSISFSGPWAQFRLFGAGQLTGVQDGNFTVRFSVDGGAMTYRVHTDTEDNPFSGGLFSQFGLSDTLY